MAKRIEPWRLLDSTYAFSAADWFDQERPDLRLVGKAASKAIAGKYAGGYQLSPAAKAVEHAATFSIRDLPGCCAGLPTGQPWTTHQFLYDALRSGEARLQDVTDWLRGAVYGTPPK